MLTWSPRGSDLCSEDESERKAVFLEEEGNAFPSTWQPEERQEMQMNSVNLSLLVSVHSRVGLPVVLSGCHTGEPHRSPTPPPHLTKTRISGLSRPV